MKALISMLQLSEDKQLNHFQFNDVLQDIDFFLNEENKDVLETNVSIPCALVKCLQSQQMFPPYKSWELTDLLEDFELTYGSVYINPEHFDFEYDNESDTILQLFNHLGYKASMQGFDYVVFDSNDILIVLSSSAYVVLAHYFVQSQMIHQDAFDDLISKISV